ncbi:MAG: inorganic phosphate transporter [Acidobacteria bacterium]|nr:MAG: inorganic phosphate transporter [Acidobacteriota bacterium]
MILLIALAVLFVALANGANDNFKGVATLHGSGTLGYRRALAWATLTTLAGSLAAMLAAGGLVQRFSGKGLVADAVAADHAFLLGVAAAAALTVLLATRLGFPVSTTHALLGALVGAGLVMGGPRQLSYATLGRSFVAPLLFSPVVSLLLAASVYRALRSARRALGVGEQTCVCIGGAEELASYVPGAGTVRLASGIAVAVDQLDRCERRYAGRVFGFDAQGALDRLHLLAAGAVGFARGLNDTPKIVALLIAARALDVPAGSAVVAAAMAAGGLLFARRVARTMAFGITGMNHGQGFSANLVTATIVTLASPLGLPVSTTHVACGALFGIGLVNGEARGKTIAEIVAAWVTTLPIAALLGAGAASFVR